MGELLSGILVYTFAPEAEGHGTDAAVEAFHFKGGKVRPIVPLIKVLSSAITIGSGGAAGSEGPTAQISVGVGSMLGPYDFLRYSLWQLFATSRSSSRVVSPDWKGKISY